MKRIAITGANGFIGRHVVRQAVASGYEVVGFVRSEAAARVVREAGGSPVELVGRDPEAMVHALDGCLAVVHLAQIGAERGGQTYEAVNVGYTERVLEDARHAGVPRVVYFSGLGVARYGMSLRCSNAYFLSKLAAETILFRSGLEGVVFRPSYVVGPGDAFVPAVLRRWRRGRWRCRATAPTACSRSTSRTPRPACSPRSSARRRPSPRSSTSRAPRPCPTRGCSSGSRRWRAGWAGGPSLRVRSIPVEEADRRARGGGYQGMLPDELDCLLCDEVADPAPLEALLGRPLTPLDEALAAAVRGA